MWLGAGNAQAPQFFGPGGDISDFMRRRTRRAWKAGPPRGGREVVGTPEAVAVELDAFVDRVVPLLQERGAFRTEYTGTTPRSHLGLPEPVWKG